MSTRSLNHISFHPDAPKIDLENVRAKFAAWSTGRVVASTMEVVGHIKLPRQHISLLNDPDLTSRTYDFIEEYEPLFAKTEPLRNSLRQIVNADLYHTDLRDSEIFVDTMAGLYDFDRHGQPLHTDNYGEQHLRWTVSHGLPGTVGGIGDISTMDLSSELGDLRPKTEQGLRIVRPKEGAIVRFTSSDAHRSCEGQGPRILTIAKVAMP